MPTRSLLSTLVVASLVLPGCVAKQLPPPPPPPAALPDVAMPDVAPDAGLARVLVSTDVPARVTHIESLQGRAGRGSMQGTVEDLVCETTPCALTLPYGDHELRFAALNDAERSGSTIVHVRTSTVVVNHTLGRCHTPAGQGLGGFIVGLGIATALAAGIVAKNAPSGDVGPVALAGAGLTTVIGGFVVMGIAPTTDQPGATREWSPSPPGAGAQLSLGARF